MFMTCGHTHMRPELWANRPRVPVMIVASNYLSGTGKLRTRPIPEQCRPAFCDSGGFYFHAHGIDYPFTPEQYVAWLRVMQPNYSATMDYPCEEEIAANDSAVLSRQIRALAHAETLLTYDVSWQWLPVLQGRTVEQYRRHASMYRDAQLVQPLMGIGSLCRRTRVADILAIVDALHAELPDTRFHLFGVKALIFKQRDALPDCVFSADSGAWNGMFGAGRTKWKHAQARGLRQVEYELHEALPAYQARIHFALDQPKQLTMGGGW